AGSPRLGHIGAEILDREGRLVPLGAGIELRELVEEEVAPRLADRASDPCRLHAEAVPLEAQGNHGIVMPPYGPGLIVVRVECGMLAGESANAPWGPHVGRHQTLDDLARALGRNDAGPQAMAWVGGNS